MISTVEVIYPTVHVIHCISFLSPSLPILPLYLSLPTTKLFLLTAKHFFEVSSHELLLWYLAMLLDRQDHGKVRSIEGMLFNGINYVSECDLGGQGPAVEYDWILWPLPAIN